MSWRFVTLMCWCPTMEDPMLELEGGGDGSEVLGPDPWVGGAESVLLGLDPWGGGAKFVLLGLGPWGAGAESVLLSLDPWGGGAKSALLGFDPSGGGAESVLLGLDPWGGGAESVLLGLDPWGSSWTAVCCFLCFAARLSVSDCSPVWSCDRLTPRAALFEFWASFSFSDEFLPPWKQEECYSQCV